MSTPPTEPTASSGFEAFGLHPSLLEALAALGYEEPTPIQRESLPPLLEGRDVLGLAATGTGKTAAFALPLLHRMTPGAAGPGEASALVLVPTRELAMQVAEAVHTYGRGRGVRVLPIYGGTDIGAQLKRLKRGVDVVVATPGRALDHLRRGSLSLARVRSVVLDEADEMLDMGFAEDLEAILESVPEDHQTALFSATLPPRISAIAGRHLREPVRVQVAREPMEAGTLPRVRQTAYVVPRALKGAALARVLDVENPTSAIIFCRTRTEVDTLSSTLNGRGMRAEPLHGGLSQAQRDRVLKRFKAHEVELLVATDVAARGLHVEKLSHVFNYDLPSAPEAYVHRIGRTGRAGREGVAITLAEPREHRFLKQLERVTGQPIEVATVPTVADLRARRLELTRASVREALVGGELDSFRVVVESLAEEADLMDVAASAVKLVHMGLAGAAVEEEIPAFAPPSERAAKGKKKELGAPRPSRRERLEERARPPARAHGEERVRPPVRALGEERARPPTRAHGEERATRPLARKQTGEHAWPSARGAAGERPRTPVREPRGALTGDMVTLSVNVGRKAGMRPADLVGAIANEAGVPARSIGAIEIADAFSRVEVPAQAAPRVMAALRATTLRGRKVAVRREEG